MADTGLTRLLPQSADTPDMRPAIAEGEGSAVAVESGAAVDAGLATVPGDGSGPGTRRNVGCIDSSENRTVVADVAAAPGTVAADTARSARDLPGNCRVIDRIGQSKTGDLYNEEMMGCVQSGRPRAAVGETCAAGESILLYLIRSSYRSANADSLCPCPCPCLWKARRYYASIVCALFRQVHVRFSIDRIVSAQGLEQALEDRSQVREWAAGR
jgi:hypothetical protein